MTADLRVLILRVGITCGLTFVCFLTFAQDVFHDTAEPDFTGPFRFLSRVDRVSNSQSEESPEDSSDDSTSESSEDRIDELATLRKRIDELEAAERKRAAKEKKTSDDDKNEADTDATKAGDWIDVSSEKWNVKLGGHVQLDYVNWAQSDPAIIGDQDYFEFRRLRLVADGTGYGVYDFRLQMTLEPDSTEGLAETSFVPPITPSVKDAYFSINEIPWLGRLRIGNFFVPFSLEQVTNDTNNIFIERSIPTQGV
ncbi:MAG: hypothetical protein FJ267_19440, partial [Planctomycetes bacterium]|nr:hypothetical protein [Planctomycetota bacterium]